MKKLNVNMKAVGNIVKKGSVILVYGVTMALPYVSRDLIEAIRYSGNVKYSDAFKVIMDSPMFSGDKNKAIAMIKHDKDSDYYKAIIQVVKSNMWSGDKLAAIQSICDQYEVKSEES